MQVHANIFPQVIFAEGAALATPAAGTVVVYAKADGLLYQKDDAGVESPLVTNLTTVLAMLQAAVTHNFGSDASYVLSDSDAASSVFIATDTGPVLTVARSLTFPALFSPKLFHNATAQTLTVKKSGQPGTAVAAGDTALVFSGPTDTIVFAGGGGGTFVGGSLTTALNEAKGADLASAGTVDIGAATGNLVHITGTTTITDLGTVQAGTERVLVFDGILTLTHNAVSLILPTGANIVTAAGDVAFMRSEGAGNWRCVGYQRASGAPLAGGGVTTVNGASGTPLVLVPFAIAFSDETTAITAGTNKARWINPSDKVFNVVHVAASLNVAQASGSIFTLDINEAGSSILSTKLTIDNGETVGGSHASAGSTTPAVISDASIAGFAQVSVDVDQVGNGSAAGGKVYLIGYWTP